MALSIFFFRKRKPQGVSDMKCLCHLLVWEFCFVCLVLFIFFVWFWCLKAVYMHILVNFCTFLN